MNKKVNVKIDQNDFNDILNTLDLEQKEDVNIVAFSKYQTKFNDQFSIVFSENLKSISKMKLGTNALKILLHLIATLTNGNGNILVNFSQSSIASALSLKASNVSRSFKELYDKQILVKDEHKNVYLNCNVAIKGMPNTFKKDKIEKYKESQKETDELIKSIDLDNKTQRKRSKKSNDIF